MPLVTGRSGRPVLSLCIAVTSAFPIVTRTLAGGCGVAGGRRIGFGCCLFAALLTTCQKNIELMICFMMIILNKTNLLAHDPLDILVEPN